MRDFKNNAVFVPAWLGPTLCVCLDREMSAYGRLKMQCLYVTGTSTDCPLRDCALKCSVCTWSWEHDLVRVCLGEISAYGRFEMQCLMMWLGP